MGRAGEGGGAAGCVVGRDFEVADGWAGVCGGGGVLCGNFCVSVRGSASGGCASVFSGVRGLVGGVRLSGKGAGHRTIFLTVRITKYLFTSTSI